MIRNAIAVWNGSGKEGGGHLTTQSTVLNKTQYSFNSRFENGVGTNPEELVAAAHAGCFSMKLAFDLGAKGFIPKSIETSCNITFDNGVLSKSHLIVKASIEGISSEQFQEIVEGAKDNCPISKVLNTEISFEATLIS